MEIPGIRTIVTALKNKTHAINRKGKVDNGEIASGSDHESEEKAKYSEDKKAHASSHGLEEGKGEHIDIEM